MPRSQFQPTFLIALAFVFFLLGTARLVGDDPPYPEGIIVPAYQGQACSSPDTFNCTHFDYNRCDPPDNNTFFCVYPEGPRQADGVKLRNARKIGHCREFTYNYPSPPPCIAEVNIYCARLDYYQKDQMGNNCDTFICWANVRYTDGQERCVSP